MIEAKVFLRLLRKYSKVPEAGMDDVLFGGGLDLSSIGFTEMVMELEEECDVEIDIDNLDASIRTAGQLFARLTGG